MHFGELDYRTSYTAAHTDGHGEQLAAFSGVSLIPWGRGYQLRVHGHVAVLDWVAWESYIPPIACALWLEKRGLASYLGPLGHKIFTPLLMILHL